MLGLMSDQQLLISSLIEHSGKYHGQTEIVDCDTDGKIYKWNEAAYQADNNTGWEEVS